MRTARCNCRFSCHARNACPPIPTMHTPLPRTHPCHTCPPATHTPLPCTPPPDRILDTRLWKYYLAATSLRAVTIKLRSSVSITCVSSSDLVMCLVCLDKCNVRGNRKFLVWSVYRQPICSSTNERETILFWNNCRLPLSVAKQPVLVHKSETNASIHFVIFSSENV